MLKRASLPVSLKTRNCHEEKVRGTQQQHINNIARFVFKSASSHVSLKTRNRHEEQVRGTLKIRNIYINDSTRFVVQSASLQVPVR